MKLVLLKSFFLIIINSIIINSRISLIIIIEDMDVIIIEVLMHDHGNSAKKIAGLM